MHFSRSQRARLVNYGLRAGLPYGALKNVGLGLSAAGRVGDYFRRKKLAGEIAAKSQWRDFVPKDQAFRAFTAGEIPGLEPLINLCERLYAERRDETLSKPLNGATFHKLTTIDDLAAYPEFLDTALNPAVIESVASYMGTIPRIQAIELWLSPVSDAPIGSQLYHLDKPDCMDVTMFVNITPIDEDNGPLTFIPGDLSRKVCELADYAKTYFCGDGRMPDAELLKHVSPDSILKATGVRGSGSIVDTSACLHQGSRCTKRERVVASFRYLLPHAIRPTLPRKIFASHVKDELTRLLLEGV